MKKAKIDNKQIIIIFFFIFVVWYNKVKLIYTWSIINGLF